MEGWAIAVVLIFVLLLIIGAVMFALAMSQATRRKMMYCVTCRRNVFMQKPFNWVVFFYLCGIFYLPFYLMRQYECPICGGNQFAPPREDG